MSGAAYLHLLQLRIGYVGTKHTRDVAPQAAGSIGALIHAPSGVVAKVLVRGAALPAHALELPRLVAPCADSLLPVGSVCGSERRQFWCGDHLLHLLGLLFRGRRRLELLHAVDGVPKDTQTIKRKRKELNLWVQGIGK